MEASTVEVSIFTAGGHHQPLAKMERLRFNEPIVMRQLDTRHPKVLDRVLRDVMAEHKAGMLPTIIRYDGKHPTRWFDMIYPPALEPVLLGAFYTEGQAHTVDSMLGWCSLLRAMQRKDVVSMGAIVHPRYRDRGLGTTMLAHAVLNAGDMFPCEGRQHVYFATLKTNVRVRAIAQKMAMVPAGETQHQSGAKMLLFTTVEGLFDTPPREAPPP